MNEKILIVEDDPFTQQFYKFFFERAKYDILITENGDQVFKYLQEEHVILLILDINLKNTYYNQKKTDGLEIAKMIKENTDYCDVPILLVTAYQNKLGNTQFFSERLADDYIIKPIYDFNELLAKVKKLIK